MIDREDTLARAVQLLEDLEKYCLLTYNQAVCVATALDQLDNVFYSFEQEKLGE